LPERDDLITIAKTVVGSLESLRLPAGGFREASLEHPAQSNPHMHLLEACLAWEEIDEDSIWTQRADEIVGLCLTRFIDANGALHEFFTEDWALQLGTYGRIVEPGHQFEWAWLLERWGRLRGDQTARQAARRLFEIGTVHGIDPARGVAVHALLDDFSVHEPMARLWPQTERIKVALILAQGADTPEQATRYFDEAALGIQGLEKYLATPIPGLWRDKLKPDGVFIEEPAPASSFYHIVCAIAELHDRLPDHFAIAPGAIAGH
jgi:mannose-6-phosphate isomerase